MYCRVMDEYGDNEPQYRSLLQVHLLHCLEINEDRESDTWTFLVEKNSRQTFFEHVSF